MAELPIRVRKLLGSFIRAKLPALTLRPTLIGGALRFGWEVGVGSRDKERVRPFIQAMRKQNRRRISNPGAANQGYQSSLGNAASSSVFFAFPCRKPPCPFRGKARLTRSLCWSGLCPCASWGACPWGRFCSFHPPKLPEAQGREGVVHRRPL